MNYPGRPLPRLVRAMRWVAILNTSEAGSAIYMLRHKLGDHASEAVDHFGGCRAVIIGAIRARHVVRDMCAEGRLA